MSQIFFSSNKFVIADVRRIFNSSYRFFNSNHCKKNCSWRLNRGLDSWRKQQVFAVQCSKLSEKMKESRNKDECLDTKGPQILRRWDVPWDWKTTVYVMMPYLMSIAFAGITGPMKQSSSSGTYSLSVLSELQNIDEAAMRMLVDQFLKSFVKLSILYFFVSQHQPFQEDILTIRLAQPFSPQSGFLLWAGGGLVVASSFAFLLNCLTSGLNVEQVPNQAESLVRLLPLIGSSSVSTACVLAITGIFAPICEETIYRGFLFPSLMKWFPLPVSIALSSAVFTLAHQSSGKSLCIFIFGTVLGLVYAQTRNLLAPIVMHSLWNVGVILFLTVLQMQGFEIHNFIL